MAGKKPIKLNENDIKQLVSMIIKENGYLNDSIPLVQQKNDIQIKYDTVYQILQDLNKVVGFMDSIRPMMGKNNAEFGDKYNRLKRAITNLRKVSKI